jgi:DNA helicase II / ATP-dependent DNA helicase PcrA
MSDASSDDWPLDDEQRAAAESADTAIAVLAGPGSGKTRVLSYRARHLLRADSRLVKALLLTFTNKAAAEMKARSLDVATVTSDRVWASTFHTFGLRMLRSHGELVGINREFEIPEDDEQGEIAELAAQGAGTSNRARRWSYLRLRRYEVRESEVLQWAEAYEDLKRQRSVLDFDDLIVLTADLFEQQATVAEAYGTQYQHLLVDEFQDTNAAQFAIVRALSRWTRTVSVFADDDQAIYQFAGAEARNVRRFIGELGAREYPLTTNYRCRAEIVDVANRLIAADDQGSGRRMRTSRSGGLVRSLVFPTIEAEAAGLAEDIGALIRSGVAPADVAVLARARFRVQPLLHELERRQLPITNWLGAAYHPEERIALGVCLSMTQGRLTDRQAKRLFQFFEVDEIEERAPLALLQTFRGSPGWSELLDLRDLVWAGADLRTIVDKAHDAVVSVRPDLHASMSRLIDTVGGFARFDPDFSLSHLLGELTLGSVGGAPTTGGGVKVATLQATKGLQWSHVYILGLEEGRLPDFHAETDEQIREERRICFVGVCRAEDNLTLTRTQWYSVHRQRASRFLSEMGLQ